MRGRRTAAGEGGAREALVLGFGASGRAAAELLVAEGAKVTLVDGADTPALREKSEPLRSKGVTVWLGVGPQLPAWNGDLCVVSPGLSVDSPWVRTLAARGIPVVSELELGGRRCRAPMLAVTGTNGKSTLVRLCEDALRAAGRRVALGGNYGTPLCDLAGRSGDLDWVVVEVSTFQLETAVTFRPGVGVLLNVQPDHLDRHGSMEAYRALKFRLFERMGAGDTAIVAREEQDGARAGWAAHGVAPGPVWRSFGAADADVTYDDGTIRFPGLQGQPELSVANTVFHNPVMGLTAAAAAAAVLACGEDAAWAARAARDFTPLAHRVTPVTTLRGVRFIDDSKATNLAAMCAGLAMAQRPVRLIAGGQMKETDLDWPKEVLAKHAVKVYLIGECMQSLWNAWHDRVPCVLSGDMRSAVRQAWRDAEAGDTILLSPACASFDQFRSYAHRGDVFVAEVGLLSEET